MALAFGRVTGSRVGPNFMVSTNVDEVKSAMTQLERGQLPYAIALTLTRTAEFGQTIMRRRVRSVFKLHTDFIPYNIKRTRARKQDVIMGAAEATIYTDKKIGFMSLHEVGGPKLPAGVALTPPGSEEARNLPGFKTATGKVSAKYQPKNLMHASFSIKNKRRIGGGSKKDPQAFKIKDMIVKRKSKDDPKLITLFRYIPQGKMKKRFEFEQTLLRVTQRIIGPIAKREMEKAVASARANP